MPDLEKLSPLTGELLASYPMASETDVQACIADSRAAWQQWGQSPLAIRQKLLKAAARRLTEHADTWAELISSETGKPLKDAIETDITLAASVLNYYARIGPKLLRTQRRPLDQSALVGQVHYERHVPRGVIAVISPWNFPLAIPVSGIAAALMGGNTVVLKPSELTPGVGEKLGQLFKETAQELGLPNPLVSVVTGDGSTGKALVDGDINYCIFTGSAKTGRSIQSTLAQRGISCSLELGGSCPMIVLKDTSSLEQAASYAVWSRFVNSGQACAAIKRLYVHADRYDEAVQILKSKIEHLKYGLPDDPESHLGPLISESQRSLIAAQVDDALAKGAVAETGGSIPDQPGWFYPPTLLSNVPLNSRVVTEETFGPVLPVIPYTSEEEVVQMANNTNYGLTGCVFGPPDRAEQIAQQLETGIVAINGVGMTNYGFVSIPWQGRKDSGPGVSHSPHALLDTTETQTVTKNLLFLIPGFQKAPWLFSGNGPNQDMAFSKALMRAFGGGGLLAKLDPQMVLGLLRHRSSKQL